MAGIWPDCPHCDREYRYDASDPSKVPPPCCGEPLCRAKQYWTPEQWMGRARMAEAAIGGGVMLSGHPTEDGWMAERVAYVPSEWDLEALRRAR